VSTLCPLCLHSLSSIGLEVKVDYRRINRVDDVAKGEDAICEKNRKKTRKRGVISSLQGVITISISS
jgi:hypothetical protein